MTRRIWFLVWMELVGGLALLDLTARAEQVSPSTAWDAYRRGNYRQSQSQYSELAKKSPDDPRLRFNAGAAAFRQNDLTNAANWFESVLAAPDLQLQQQAYYNLGNARYRLGESLQDPQARKQLWSEALTNFVSAMKLDQSDTNATANYAYVRQQLQQLEQQQPPPQQQQKQDQQKNQDQKDQDNEKQDSQDQQQKDQQKQDPSQKQQDNADSQKQKQSGKPDQEKDNSGAEPQSSGEKSESDAKKESEAKSSNPGESGEGKEGQEGEAQGAEAGQGEEGQMSAAQAVQMLESRKGDEKALLLRSTGSGKEAAERAARIRKPW